MASGSEGDGASNSGDIPRGLINRTGNPIGRGSRLPSVRGHRDLTLGGIQRKVFTPNLAAVKRASSKEDVSKSNTPVTPLPGLDKQDGTTGKSRGKSEKGRGRGRGRGSADDRTIQLQSEFAYGPMGGQGTSSGWKRGRESRDGGGGDRSAGASDSVAVKTAVKRSQGSEEDKKMLDSLMRDDFISDLSLGDPKMAPIRLPLNVNKLGIKSEIKTEVKDEFMDTSETDARNEIKPGSSLHQSPPPSASVMDIFNQCAKSEKGELLFLQFPDTLPGFSVSDLNDDHSSSKPSSSSNAGNREEEVLKRLCTCQLKDCSEGYMGKLRIRKSGKAELVLGDNVMEVFPGIPINSHQELVSIHTDDNPGQMIVIGPVNHKLVITPDYGDLLSHVNKFS